MEVWRSLHLSHKLKTSYQNVKAIDCKGASAQPGNCLRQGLNMVQMFYLDLKKLFKTVGKGPKWDLFTRPTLHRTGFSKNSLGNRNRSPAHKKVTGTNINALFILFQSQKQCHVSFRAGITRNRFYKREYNGETNSWVELGCRDVTLTWRYWTENWEGTMPSCLAWFRKTPSIKRLKMTLRLGKYKSIELTRLLQILSNIVCLFLGNYRNFCQIPWVSIIMRFSVYSVSTALTWFVLFWLDNIILPYYLIILFT